MRDEIGSSKLVGHRLSYENPGGRLSLICSLGGTPPTSASRDNAFCHTSAAPMKPY